MPQTGNFQLIELYRSPNPATVPVLLEGEPAVTIAPAATKVWLGDGTISRLLLSTVDADTPILTAPYAKLNGATFTGAVIWTTAPTINGHLANKEYVDQTVAAGQLYQGTYDASTNDPDLSLTANQPSVNGGFFIVSVAGTIPITVPGFTTPTPVNPGDHIVWNDTLSEFSVIPAGGMTQADGDARYLRLGAANTMTAGGWITMPTGYAPAAALDVATMGYAQSLVTNMLTAVVTDTSLAGNGTSATPLRVAIVNGGVF